jgi:hypothetical protein
MSLKAQLCPWFLYSYIDIILGGHSGVVHSLEGSTSCKFHCFSILVLAR